MSGRDKTRILCVSRSPVQLKQMRLALSSAKYDALSASTPEQAVAVCVSNQLAAVVLDSEFLTDGWSAPQTLKMVNPRVPVVLLGWPKNGEPPHGVDAIAETYSHLVHKLEALLKSRP